jgi:non-canonical (house-cleaning) NTP pyrophosphatase
LGKGQGILFKNICLDTIQVIDHLLLWQRIASIDSAIVVPPTRRNSEENKELGEADDIVFGITNSKQANGAVCILTGDILTRPHIMSQR